MANQSPEEVFRTYKWLNLWRNPFALNQIIDGLHFALEGNNLFECEVLELFTCNT